MPCKNHTVQCQSFGSSNCKPKKGEIERQRDRKKEGESGRKRGIFVWFELGQTNTLTGVKMSSNLTVPFCLWIQLKFYINTILCAHSTAREREMKIVFVVYGIRMCTINTSTGWVHFQSFYIFVSSFVVCKCEQQNVNLFALQTR